MRISFALVVWGESYIREFLEISLPTLLAEGNLRDAGVGEGSRFQILTRTDDRRLLEASPLFRRLGRILPIEFLDVGDFIRENKYFSASRCQIEALRRSEEFDAIFLLYPDVIWSRGAIRFAIERLAAGALAFFSPAPTVLPEEMRRLLHADAENVIDTPDGEIVSVTPRKLVGAALRCYHPMWDGLDWDGGCFSDFSSCLRWNVADQGWLIRCFHLHPVALRVQRDNPMFFAKFRTSLDGEYVARLFDGTSRLAFATDSDEFAIVSVRDKEMPPFPSPGRQPSIAAVARWAEANAYLLHRAFVNVEFRWHQRPIDEAAWRPVEERARAIVAEVTDRLHTPDSIVRVEDPEAYRMRRARRHNAYMWRQPRIDLPPSQLKRSRAELVRLLLYKLSYGTAWRAANAVRTGPLGRWLVQQPLFVRLWLRAKPKLRPKSEIDAALSSRNLVRNIIRHDADDGA